MSDHWNDPIIIKENKKLQELNPELSISQIVSNNSKICGVGLSIPVKGNAELLRKLDRLGYKPDYREKRGNSFYQIVKKSIWYDKYAIYQRKYGLYAKLYIDNFIDYHRHHIFGQPDFPMVINKVGGYCSFSDKDESFLYIKEVLAGEEPLTREEMFPKNNDNFWYGWIDPQGNTYSCSFENHYDASEAICEELKFGSFRPERTLEEKGWLKVSRKAPYTPENINSRTIYSSTFRLTKAQIDKIYELGLDNDQNIAWLLNECFDRDDR